MHAGYFGAYFAAYFGACDRLKLTSSERETLPRPCLVFWVRRARVLENRLAVRDFTKQNGTEFCSPLHGDRMLLDVLGPRRMLLDLMVLSLAQAEIIDFGNDWDSRQVPTFANESPLSFAAAKAARVTANLPDDLSSAYPVETILELLWGRILVVVAFATIMMFLVVVWSCAKPPSVARDEGAAVREAAPLEAAPNETAQHEAVPHETAQHEAMPLVSPPRQQRICLPQRSKTAPSRLNAPRAQVDSRPSENAANMPEPKRLFVEGTDAQQELRVPHCLSAPPREEMPSGDEMGEQDATQPYARACGDDEVGAADSDDSMMCEDAERLLSAVLGGGAKASNAEHTSAQGTANATQTKCRSAPSDATNQVRAAAVAALNGSIGNVGSGLNDSRRQACARTSGWFDMDKLLGQDAAVVPLQAPPPPPPPRSETAASSSPAAQQQKKHRGQQEAMDIEEDAAGPLDENSPRARENKREDAGASEDEAKSTASSTSLSSSATSSSRPRDLASRAWSPVSDEGMRGLGKRKRAKPDRYIYVSSRRNAIGAINRRSLVQLEV